jgi:tetratricopeptide (TPR) repeat protein
MSSSHLRIHNLLRLIIPKSILILLICNFNYAYSQVDITKYFNESQFNFLNTEDYLRPEFKWNMSGQLQAELNDGISFIEEDNLELAIASLEKALKIDSTLWVSHYYMGICYKRIHDVQRAEKYLLKSISLNPQLAEAHVELGEVYQMRNLFQKAAYRYDQAIKTAPKLVQGYFNLGNLKFLAGDLSSALKQYQICNEINPNFPDSYLMKGILKFKVKKNDNESIAYFTQAITADSSFSLAYFWRGLAYLSLEQSEKCIEEWNTLIQFNPENLFYTLMRGFLFIELKDFDKAFIDLKKVLKAGNIDEDKFIGAQTEVDKRIDLYVGGNYLISTGYGFSDEVFSLLKKGFCLALAGNYQEALKSYDEAQALRPSACVYFLKAIAYEHSNEHIKALQYYTLALKVDKDIFDAHKKRCVYRIELKDWNGVDEDLMAMFRIQPKSTIAYRLSGIAKSNKGDYQAAINDLNEFIKSDSSDLESLRTRASCYLLLNKSYEANEDLRRLLRVDVKNWVLREDVVNNYLILKDTTKAIDVLNEGIELKPTLHLLHLKVAELYIAQQKWTLAESTIKAAEPLMNIDFMPKDFSRLYYWQGVIEFHQNKNYELASTRFKASLKLNENYLAAKYFLADCYVKLGLIKKAMVEFKELMSVGYKDSAARFNSIKE